MILRAGSQAEVVRELSVARQRRERITGFDLRAMNRLVAHAPEDMTCTVEPGMTLAQLQSHLAGRGQWLPIDPPLFDRLAIGALLAGNPSGPRRFGCGTIRDHLLGLTAVLADGRVVHSGGKVVKNVAGYDLFKLFVGSRGSLGVIVEATFKLWPRPEAERFVAATCDSPELARRLMDAVLASELTPHVIDWHRGFVPGNASNIRLVLGFAGAREDVEWQLARALELGLREPASLDYEETFWSESAGPAPQRLAVLPSRLDEAVRTLGGIPFVARAGNGTIYFRGVNPFPKPALPVGLIQRVKAMFDPDRLLPDAPAG